MTARDPVTLVLASASPRRAQLLRDAGIDFEVRASHADESVPPETLPAQAAVLLAVRKAEAVDAPYVLAADTLLDDDGAILGKPKDAADARAMLRSLSGRAHWVVTGVAVRRGKDVWTGLDQTRVTFRELSDGEIAAYVATGEPLDKAGAYAIQGGARGFVADVRGSVDTVIGLPMGVVKRLLEASAVEGSGHRA